MMKITVTIPITSSSVNSISITVSLRLGHATVVVFSGYLSISTILY